MPDAREALSAALRKQFRIHGGVTEDAVADAVAEVLAPTVALWTPMDDPHLARCVHDVAHGVPPLEPAARQAVVDQFRAALHDGLDDLQRFDPARLVDPGDVADMIERVALEVGR